MDYFLWTGMLYVVSHLMFCERNESHFLSDCILAGSYHILELVWNISIWLGFNCKQNNAIRSNKTHGLIVEFAKKSNIYFTVSGSLVWSESSVHILAGFNNYKLSRRQKIPLKHEIISDHHFSQKTEEAVQQVCWLNNMRRPYLPH